MNKIEKFIRLKGRGNYSPAGLVFTSEEVERLIKLYLEENKPPTINPVAELVNDEKGGDKWTPFKLGGLYNMDDGGADTFEYLGRNISKDKYIFVNQNDAFDERQISIFCGGLIDNIKRTYKGQQKEIK